MIKAYINYPNPHITAHSDSGCGKIRAQNKTDQRYCQINIKTISEELQNFRDKKYLFGSSPQRNDIWLEINFGDQAFELAVLEYIAGILGEYYTPFKNLKPEIHC